MTNLLVAAIYLHFDLRNELPEKFPTDVDVGFLPNPNNQSDFLVVIQNVVGYTTYVGQKGCGAHSAVSMFEQHLHDYGAVTDEMTSWFWETDRHKASAMMLDPTSKLVLAYPFPLKDESDNDMARFSPSLDKKAILREFKSYPKREHINKNYKESVLADNAKVVLTTNTPSKTVVCGFTNNSEVARSLDVSEKAIRLALKDVNRKGEKKKEDEIGMITKSSNYRVRFGVPGEKLGRTERGRTDPIWKVERDGKGKRWKDDEESSGGDDSEDSKPAATESRRASRARKRSGEKENSDPVSTSRRKS